MRRDLQQPVAHQWPVRVLGEDLQQIELARREALFIAVARVDQYPPFEIEHTPADANTRETWPWGRRPGGPPQHALDPRQELARLERLGDVVVGAAFEPDDTIDGIAGGGDHDDPDAAAPLAQPARQREPVLPRQPDIEHDQGRQFALDEPAQGGTVG